MGSCAFNRADASSREEPSRFMSRCSWISAELPGRCISTVVGQGGRKGEEREVLHLPVHHHDLPDPLPQPALDEQRHIQHTRALAPPPTPHHRPKHRPPHGGVHDRIELRALRGVGEDERAEGRAVECAVRAEDRGPERARDRRERGRARGDGVAREDVGVDDGQAVGAEEGGDG